MKDILYICAVLACQAYGRPQDSANKTAPAERSGHAGNVTVVKNEFQPVDANGAFSYDIELSDGTKFMQVGHTEPPEMGQNKSGLVIEGSYAYISPEGKHIRVSYKADKNGFQPKSDAIPTQGGNSNSPDNQARSGGIASTTANAEDASLTSSSSPAYPAPSSSSPTNTSVSTPDSDVVTTLPPSIVAGKHSNSSYYSDSN